MKIQSEKLKNFVQKVSLNGGIPTLLLECTEQGMVCKVRSQDNARACMGILNSTAFVKHEAGIKLPIRESKALIDILKLFSAEVTMEVQNNNLVIFDATQDAIIPLASEEFIENKLPLEFEEKFGNAFDGGINIPDGTIGTIRSHLSLLKPTRATITIKEKQLSVGVVGSKQDKLNTKMTADYKDCTVQVNAKFLQEALAVLTGDINYACMGDGQLIQVKEANDDLNVRVVIAPVVDNEE